MSPCSPPERRLGAWGWALVTDISSQMYIFTSRRFDGDSCSRASNLADFMQWRNIVSKPDLCQGCSLDIVEACVQILNKYERLFTKERQEPSGHADAFTLTCMFVYCGSEEYYGFVSCCCTKSRTSPKLKTFFHWYVFVLVRFSATYGSRNVNRSGKNNRHDSSWMARLRVSTTQPEHREIVSLTKRQAFSVL